MPVKRSSILIFYRCFLFHNITVTRGSLLFFFRANISLVKKNFHYLAFTLPTYVSTQPTRPLTPKPFMEMCVSSLYDSSYFPCPPSRYSFSLTSVEHFLCYGFIEILVEKRKENEKHRQKVGKILNLTDSFKNSKVQLSNPYNFKKKQHADDFKRSHQFFIHPLSWNLKDRENFTAIFLTHVTCGKWRHVWKRTLIVKANKLNPFEMFLNLW